MSGVGRKVVGDAVEDEELRLGSPVGDISDPRVDEMLLGVLCYVPRASVVVLQSDRVSHVGDYRQGVGEEWVNGDGVDVWHEQHIGFVDRLKRSNTGAVETDARSEHRGVHFPFRQSHVLPSTRHVNEFDVDPIGASVAHQLQHVIGGLHWLLLQCSLLIEFLRRELPRLTFSR